MTQGLSVQEISKCFGTAMVLDGVSLEAPTGRITALIGRNGAGKSTLFKILMGLVPADAGDALLDGKRLLDVPLQGKAGLGLGYLPQECGSFPDLSIRENLSALLELLPIDQKERERRFDRVVDTTGIGGELDRPFKFLSRGEQRRLEIAKTLVTDPRFLLLDEPFSGLDPGIVEEIISVFQRLRSEGKGILLTDHNVFMALPAADHGYLLASGTIACEGSPDQLASSDIARSLYFGAGYAGAT